VQRRHSDQRHHEGNEPASDAHHFSFFLARLCLRPSGGCSVEGAEAHGLSIPTDPGLRADAPEPRNPRHTTPLDPYFR
jgi:hypothetical protein